MNEAKQQHNKNSQQKGKTQNTESKTKQGKRRRKKQEERRRGRHSETGCDKKLDLGEQYGQTATKRQNKNTKQKACIHAGQTPIHARKDNHARNRSMRHEHEYCNTRRRCVASLHQVYCFSDYIAEILRQKISVCVSAMKFKSCPKSYLSSLVAHDCGYSLSRYTCRVTRVAADFLDLKAFCRCSGGVALHP